MSLSARLKSQDSARSRNTSRPRPKPEWNPYQHDLEEYRLSTNKQHSRRLSLISPIRPHAKSSEKDDVKKTRERSRSRLSMDTRSSRPSSKLGIPNVNPEGEFSWRDAETLDRLRSELNRKAQLRNRMLQERGIVFDKPVEANSSETMLTSAAAGSAHTGMSEPDLYATLRSVNGGMDAGEGVVRENYGVREIDFDGDATLQMEAGEGDLTTTEELLASTASPRIPSLLAWAAQDPELGSHLTHLTHSTHPQSHTHPHAHTPAGHLSSSVAGTHAEDYPRSPLPPSPPRRGGTENMTRTTFSPASNSADNVIYAQTSTPTRTGTHTNALAHTSPSAAMADPNYVPTDSSSLSHTHTHSLADADTGRVSGDARAGQLGEFVALMQHISARIAAVLDASNRAATDITHLNTRISALEAGSASTLSRLDVVEATVAAQGLQLQQLSDKILTGPGATPTERGSLTSQTMVSALAVALQSQSADVRQLRARVLDVEAVCGAGAEATAAVGARVAELEDMLVGLRGTVHAVSGAAQTEHRISASYSVDAPTNVVESEAATGDAVGASDTEDMDDSVLLQGTAPSTQADGIRPTSTNPGTRAPRGASTTAKRRNVGMSAKGVISTAPRQPHVPPLPLKQTVVHTAMQRQVRAGGGTGRRTSAAEVDADGTATGARELAPADAAKSTTGSAGHSRSRPKTSSTRAFAPSSTLEPRNVPDDNASSESTPRLTGATGIPNELATHQDVAGDSEASNPRRVITTQRHAAANARLHAARNMTATATGATVPVSHTGPSTSTVVTQHLSAAPSSARSHTGASLVDMDAAQLRADTEQDRVLMALASRLGFSVARGHRADAGHASAAAAADSVAPHSASPPQDVAEESATTASALQPSLPLPPRPAYSTSAHSQAVAPNTSRESRGRDRQTTHVATTGAANSSARAPIPVYAPLAARAQAPVPRPAYGAFPSNTSEAPTESMALPPRDHWAPLPSRGNVGGGLPQPFTQANMTMSSFQYPQAPQEGVPLSPTHTGTSASAPVPIQDGDVPVAAPGTWTVGMRRNVAVE